MKNRIVLSLVVLDLFFPMQNMAYGQDKKSEIAIHESIRFETDKIFDKLVEIRRDFHKYPELAGEEKRTQEVIKKHLLDLGLQVETDIYGQGIVGILEGEKRGKTIALRADMDALPDDFPDHVDFKSMTKGVKHSCGHDVHIDRYKRPGTDKQLDKYTRQSVWRRICCNLLWTTSLFQR